MLLLDASQEVAIHNASCEAGDCEDGEDHDLVEGSNSLGRQLIVSVNGDSEKGDERSCDVELPAVDRILEEKNPKESVHDGLKLRHDEKSQDSSTLFALENRESEEESSCVHPRKEDDPQWAVELESEAEG